MVKVKVMCLLAIAHRNGLSSDDGRDDDDDDDDDDDL
jgi:hypothetical protein